jgi:heptose-I-phosphate ethanolaminephosphotransferase
MPWYVSMPIAALFIYNGIFFCFQNFDSTRDNANDYNTLIMRNMLWKLHLSVQQYDVEKADLDICAQNQEIMAVDSCSYTSPNVVIIIGESFIKRHSSLYGYNKTTNPNLEKLRQTGNLSVFTDVITTRHGTSEAFKLFLSMACIKDSIRWCDTPLFPTLFKQAGYHVAFYSNQFVKESEKDRENATGAGFFYHPGIEPYIFNERNHSLNQFDEEMVQEYFEKHKKEGFKPYNLTIFHLLGQHVSYKDRYTQKYARFTEKDYDDRKDLTNSQKREVSEYDNATLYNDYVVSTIISHYQNQDAIVIYFSDHGEECNDFRPHIGRSGDWDMIERKAGIECLRCQFDIPFIIYTSPLYQQNHPEIVKEINTALDRPFMTDDLPHLLLYLAGIHTSWYDSRHNLISPNFNTKRRRLVSRVFTDYDEFCSGK